MESGSLRLPRHGVPRNDVFNQRFLKPKWLERPSFLRKRAGWAGQREARHGRINGKFACWTSWLSPTCDSEFRISATLRPEWQKLRLKQAPCASEHDRFSPPCPGCLLDIPATLQCTEDTLEQVQRRGRATRDPYVHRYDILHRAATRIGDTEFTPVAGTIAAGDDELWRRRCQPGAAQCMFHVP